ncbi:CorA Metal Ion Transporter (MIT) Family [Achlya hypogyna]|uniref:CorA Metal Ion Transporter (MIT) Family n=1 Tax=Achlya hypogyna TaxID=1202772 RepID=A0A1V9ZAB7_ACHHY|nr:CorA Metal Ion Transporter (MIT) Family [Achlya hypogyna]
MTLTTRASRRSSNNSPAGGLRVSFMQNEHLAPTPELPPLQIKIDDVKMPEEIWTSPASSKLTVEDAQLLDWDHSCMTSFAKHGSARLSSEFGDAENETREDLHILLDPYYDVTTGRMKRMFKFFSPQGIPFQKGLSALGISCPEHVDVTKLIKKIDTDHDGTISLDEFIHVVQMIKLAHLFKPEAEAGMPDATFHVTDYSATTIHTVARVKSMQSFMFSTKPAWAKVRWVHLAGISDPSDLHMRRLAIKYQFHPLALEDCLKKSDKIRCKYEHYQDHAFLVVPVLRALDHETAEFVQDVLRKHQASLFEKDLVFLDGWRDETKPDVAALETTLGKLERLLRKPQQLCLFLGNKNDVVSVQEDDDAKDGGFHLWDTVYDRNMAKSYSKLRNHGSHFLTVSILNAIVDEVIPLVGVFEVVVRALESLQVAQGRDFDNKRIFFAKKQLVVIDKIVRPMLDLVEGQLLEQDEFREGEVKNYLRDVKDHLKQMAADIKEYQGALTGIFNEDQQARAKAQADIQFTISIIAAIFLPATFMTGLYGMNFDNIPELHTENGYFVWWGVLGFVSLAIVAFFKYIKRWI